MLPSPILQIAALPAEVLVQRIGAQHRAGGDLIPFAQRGPALHVNVRLQPGLGADGHILLHDGELAHHHSRADRGIGMNARGGRDLSGGIERHRRVSR